MDLLQETQGHHEGESPEDKVKQCHTGARLQPYLGNEAWKLSNGTRAGQHDRLRQNEMLRQCGKCVSVRIVHRLQTCST